MGRGAVHAAMLHLLRGSWLLKAEAALELDPILKPDDTLIWAAPAPLKARRAGRHARSATVDMMKKKA